MSRILLTVTVLLAAAANSGCASYTLRGKVIEGFDSGVVVVADDDPRLEEAGIRDVRINVHRDPDSLGTELIESARAEGDGSFELTLDAFGAGWMDERWLIEAARSGFQNASDMVRLPARPGGRRLLIILSPGRSTPSEHRDELWEEYQQYR